MRVVTDASTDAFDLVLVAVRYDQLASVTLNLSGQPEVLCLGNNPVGRAPLPGQVRLGFPGVGVSITDGIATYARIAQQADRAGGRTVAGPGGAGPHAAAGGVFALNG